MSSAVSASHYVKIWGILLVLLAISIAGPMLEIKAVTLITAFGIAIVKAFMVAKYFMHLAIEKRYIVYMLIGMVLIMLMFFFGIAVDIMMPRGANWYKVEQMQAPTAGEAAEHSGH